MWLLPFYSLLGWGVGYAPWPFFTFSPLPSWLSPTLWSPPADICKWFCFYKIGIDLTNYQYDDDSRIRQTRLPLLEGARQFIAASLVLAMLLPDKASLPFGGSALCFFSLISMILFLFLQVIYWLRPKRNVDETNLLENGLRPQLDPENKNGINAVAQVFRKRQMPKKLDFLDALSFDSCLSVEPVPFTSCSCRHFEREGSSEWLGPVQYGLRNCHI